MRIESFDLVFGLFIVFMTAFATLFMISEWNTRLTSWTDMQVFTMRSVMILATAFAWCCVIIVGRDILARQNRN